jgi:hypothetical protein
LNFKIFSALAFILSFNVFLYGQQNYYAVTASDTFLVRLDNKYILSKISIIPFSESVHLNGKPVSAANYKIQYSASVLSLSDTLPYSIYDTIVVTYQTVRLSLRREYKNRTLYVKFDEKTGDTVTTFMKSLQEMSSESIFGKGIEKSGTLVRGFTVGTNKDFSLNSGFRLQLAGKLADDIEIVAALTDENQPIQPEGNTERLEELDKVFIQVKHPNASATFGDYVLTKKNGEFGNVDRKLQGLIGEFNYAGSGAYFAMASSKGKYNNNKFNGSDGMQGPYRLSGVNSEKDIIIIAGTEKVYLDGEEMKRGEGNDYTIEYSNSQITFTPKRLITSASRISVDFQYTDRKFQRNFFASGVSTKLLNNRLGIRFQYLREGDDQDSPIDINLSDDDKKILAKAGNNRDLAVKTGVSLADVDSLGVRKGSYERIDTTVNGASYSYYIYSPGSITAVYNVSFSYMGEGAGDYVKESLGNYRFAGIKQGNYSPVIYLPMPELKQTGNLLIEGKPFNDLSLSLEVAGSIWDKNRLSTEGNNANKGGAYNFTLNLSPKELKIDNANLGKYGFSYKERFVQNEFTSPDRLNSIEFDRDYNIQSGVTGDERLREFSLRAQPVQQALINFSYGYLKRGDFFKSDRYNTSLIYDAAKKARAEYNLDFVSTENSYMKSNWYKQKANLFYRFDKIIPGFEFLSEDRRDKPLLADSLLSGSLRYSEYNPYLELENTYGIKFKVKYSFREDIFPMGGIFIKESNSTGQDYELSYNGIQEVSTSFKLTLRNKKYTDEYKKNGLLDNETVLIKSQSRFNFFKKIVEGDLYYEVSTQRSAKLEKVFVRVQKGTGNYKYLGDLNNNGIADENEFEPTLFDGEYIVTTVPTEELYPVIDLKTNTRWKVNLGSIFQDGFLNTALKPVTTETSWRIEENSRQTDLKKVYLLDLSSFQDENTTIRGTNQIQQDIFLFENDPALSFRFRYTQRKSLNQYFSAAERGYYRERSIRINFKMVEEISNQTDIVFEDDNLQTAVTSNRNRLVTNSNASSEFSYRPEKNIEVGFKIKVGRSVDEFPAKPTTIDINSQLLRFNVSFAGEGRLRIELERTELTGNTNDNYVPFEITSGNLLGKNYFGRLSFDYRISNNLQSSINYEGRGQGGAPAVHTARGEIRAFF